MAFGVLAGQITVIFLEVLLGYVGARSGIIKDRDSKFLSDFIMKLLLPCTMLAGAAVDGEPERQNMRMFLRADAPVSSAAPRRIRPACPRPRRTCRAGRAWSGAAFPRPRCRG